MNLPASLGLDVIRLTAALVVVAGHLSYVELLGRRFFSRIEPLGPDAVVTFFVLSGFVIAHVVSRRETNAASYFSARAARVLSVAWPALLITIAVDQLGRWVNPGFYSHVWWYKDNQPLLRLLISGLFLGQSWWRYEVRPFSNGPFWSLAYEAWFYILWGLIAFSKRYRYRLLVLLAALVAGPTILLLFPIWLCGYWLYRLLPTLRTHLLLDLTLIVTSILGYVGYRWSGYADHLSELVLNPNLLPHLGRSAHFIDSYFVAGLVMLHFTGTYLALSKLKAPIRPSVTNVVRQLSSCTFALYAVHFPVIFCVSALIGDRLGRAGRAAAIVSAILLVSFGVAKLGDELKRRIQRRLLGWADPREAQAGDAPESATMPAL